MGIFKVVVGIGEDSGDDLNVSFMGLRDHFGSGAIGNKRVAAEVSHKIDGLFAFGVGSETLDGPDGFHGEMSFSLRWFRLIFVVVYSGRRWSLSGGRWFFSSRRCLWLCSANWA